MNSQYLNHVLRTNELIAIATALDIAISLRPIDNHVELWQEMKNTLQNNARKEPT